MHDPIFLKLGSAFSLIQAFLRLALALTYLILLGIPAKFGFAQDFTKLTRNIEIDFPESSGALTFTPASGIPLPEPKVMRSAHGTITLAAKGKITCVIIIASDASVTEQSAARELSEQIGYLAGGVKPEIAYPDSLVSTPAVCVLGTSPGFFRGTRMNIPQKHEGFAIKTGTWKGRDALFVAGRDRFGVYWGVQTLKQMLYREGEVKHALHREENKARVLAPRGFFSDWPDAQYRMSLSPKHFLEGDAVKILAQFVRFGRINTTYLGVKGRLTPREKDVLKIQIGNLHRRGILCIASMNWVTLDGTLRTDDQRTNFPLPTREICPVADLGYVESLVSSVFEAGADGLSINFDDVAPNDMGHYAKCPLCRKMFKNAVEPQVHVMKHLLAFAKRKGWNDKLFLACPTLYGLHSVDRGYGITPEQYFPTFCNFPGAEKVRFFHTGFTRADLQRLSEAGFKNYVWWNNGVWPAGAIEMWGYPVGLPRMGYSWGMVNIADGAEKFFPEQLAELRYLKGKTDLVFFGTAGFLGPAIGCAFGWDMERFLFREAEFQEWCFNNEFGPGAIDHQRAWEWATKPLASKYIKGETFDKTDTQRMEAARLAADLSGSLTSQWTGKKTEGLPKGLLDTFEQGNAFLLKIKEMPGTVEKSARLVRQPDCLLSFDPNEITNYPDKPNPWATATLTGDPLKFAEMEGNKYFRMAKNRITFQTDHFAFSGRSFSIEAEFIVTTPRLSKIAGTRATFIPTYKGDLPGWGLGVTHGQSLAFTIEDENGIVSSLYGPQITRYTRYHVLAVRDFAARKLWLYVNGKKTESEEYGSGTFGPRLRPLEMSFDQWSGQSMEGLLRYVHIYDRALTDDEVRARLNDKERSK